MDLFRVLRPKWKNPDPGVRRVAVPRLTDVANLGVVAKSDTDLVVRRAAVERLAAILGSDAKTPADHGMRRAAVERLTTILGEVAKSDRDDGMRRAAVERLTTILGEVAKSDRHHGVRREAAERLTTILGEVAKSDTHDGVRREAAERLTTILGEAPKSDTHGRVECPKCGKGHPPGVFRCSDCNASLRPGFLGLVTVCGILAVPLRIVRLYFYSSGLLLPGLLVGGACIAVLIALRLGRYWAWIAIQVLIVISIAAGAFTHFSFDNDSLVIAVVQALVLLPYLHSKRVKAFCGVGRVT